MKLSSFLLIFFIFCSIGFACLYANLVQESKKLEYELKIEKQLRQDCINFIHISNDERLRTTDEENENSLRKCLLSRNFEIHKQIDKPENKLESLSFITFRRDGSFASYHIYELKDKHNSSGTWILEKNKLILSFNGDNYNCYLRYDKDKFAILLLHTDSKWSMGHKEVYEVVFYLVPWPEDFNRIKD